ncbi:glycoside hydrolase family 16 protein [Baudoinia panamericana UAMH 10762]|uniref:Glycoside hydrolase family 16 protein n=1 Tax=Baudoinia panamericana (strain UAMH 10762) TaxID=717646 RepID=M2MCX0_BAUPA|nr:glycoside hydrolase family 16 protein [Baudoinia panamericana UAMH 10762]EMC94381.1 glycoside hydrolase family 16 protein [Baudoinia panamericana UAMH 10762]
MAPFPHFHCILPLMLLLHPRASLSAASSSGSSDCTLFAVNGSSSAAAAYFTHYRFYDFRNVTNPRSPPAGQSSGLAASHTTNDSSWLLDWSPRNQARGAANRMSIPVNYLPQNVFISPANESSADYVSYLTLATSRLKNDTQSAAEIIFLPSTNVVHVSLRVFARVSGAPGAVAGIFTYNSDESESDIEILTRDPISQVRYSNQPTTDPNTGAPIAGATINATIPSGNWQEWNVHRLDWLPGQTAGWADGSRLHTSTVNVQNGTAGSQVILDMWGNGGLWSGNMDVGGRAIMEVQWIEMAFNVSGGAAGPGGTVCDIDKGVGSPVPAVSGCAGSGLGSHTWAMIYLTVVSMLWLASEL